MHWRMLCRQQSVAKTQSEAESKRAVKPRASRLAGSARGRASRIGEAVQTRQTKQVGRTKYRRKEVKTIDQSKPKAGNSPRKERTHFPRTPLHVCGRELPASSSRTAIAFSAVVAQSPAFGGCGAPPAFGGCGAPPRDRVSIFKAQ